MALIGKAGATMGFSGIYLYSSELYPTDVRNVGLGTSSVCARVSGMIAPYVGGPMVSAMFCNSTNNNFRFDRFCSDKSTKICTKFGRTPTQPNFLHVHAILRNILPNDKSMSLHFGLGAKGISTNLYCIFQHT